MDRYRTGRLRCGFIEVDDFYFMHVSVYFLAAKLLGIGLLEFSLRSMMCRESVMLTLLEVCKCRTKNMMWFSEGSSQRASP